MLKNFSSVSRANYTIYQLPKLAVQRVVTRQLYFQKLLSNTK